MNARALWSPDVAYRYGIRPWEMGRLTGPEWRAIVKHHAELERAEADGRFP